MRILFDDKTSRATPKATPKATPVMSRMKVHNEASHSAKHVDECSQDSNLKEQPGHKRVQSAATNFGLPSSVCPDDSALEIPNKMSHKKKLV